MKGIKPPDGGHWRNAPEVLTQLDNKGLIEWSSTGNPRKKIYADEAQLKGKLVQDIWVFKDPAYPIYPTEKNLEMLELIVNASSNPGDLVVDCFCGSGGTLVAANNLGRRWIGVDNSPTAIAICEQRTGIKATNVCEVHNDNMGG
jgi:adenine-specific DNA-methyltransferase